MSDLPPVTDLASLPVEVRDIGMSYIVSRLGNESYLVPKSTVGASDIWRIMHESKDRPSVVQQQEILAVAKKESRSIAWMHGMTIACFVMGVLFVLVTALFPIAPKATTAPTQFEKSK